MLEALTETVAVRGRGELKHVHGPAKRLQRALGDLRDLTRFAGLARSSQAEDGKRRKKPPPGYRRRKQKLMDDAIEAYRDLKHGRCMLTSPFAARCRRLLPGLMCIKFDRGAVGYAGHR